MPIRTRRTCTVARQCEFADDSRVWRAEQTPYHILRIRRVSHRCAFARDSSDVAIVRIACRRFRIWRTNEIQENEMDVNIEYVFGSMLEHNVVTISA